MRDKIKAKLYNQQYYVKNKLRINKQTAAYQKAHPETRAKYNTAYKRKNPQRYMWATARNNARRDGREFTITPEDIMIPEYCSYLGLKLTFRERRGIEDSGYSLDRIDNRKGYIPGNIEVISDLANRMKQNATKEQLITFANSIRSRYAT